MRKRNLRTEQIFWRSDVKLRKNKEILSRVSLKARLLIYSVVYKTIIFIVKLFRTVTLNKIIIF